MAFLSKNILTASKRSFAFKSGDAISGTPFRWQKELASREYSARWSVTTAGAPHPYICELVDPEDNPLLLALCTNALVVNGMTRHDGLANVLAAGWLKDGVYFQVLELPLDEHALGSYKPPRRMDELTFLENAERLLDAIIHLHRNNLVHVVISPEALRSADHGLTLADFWWSSSCSGTYFEEEVEKYFPQSLSNMSLLCLAPELVAGAKPLREVDLYSLGSTFFYLLAGEFPRRLDYSEDKQIDLKELAAAEMKDLRQLRPGLKPQIYRAIEFCLQKDDVARENIMLVRDLIRDAAGNMAAREED